MLVRLLAEISAEAKQAENREYTFQEKKAAVKIQQAYRRHTNQKKFGFKQLNFNLTRFTGEWARNSQKFNFTIFATGNDPELTNLASHRAPNNGQIAIVGTSGLRILSIACELNMNARIPKVIIIDNEKDVYLFWNSIRYLAAISTSDIAFLKNIQEHFKNDKKIHVGSTKIKSNQIDNGNPKIFLEKLINKFSFNYVKSIILATAVIKQSWADAKTVTSIGNILKHEGIEIVYAYLSNIISCVSSANRTTILENIARLNPVMAIHTDLCPTHHVPKKVYYVTDHRPGAVMQQIMQSQTLSLNDLSQPSLQPGCDDSDAVMQQIIQNQTLILNDLSQLLRQLRCDDNDEPQQSRSMGK